MSKQLTDIEVLKSIRTRLRNFLTTDLFQTSFWNTIATLIKMATGLVSNKIIAIYLGPGGLALLGQFSNFIAIATTISSGGITAGITKYVAEYRDSKNEQEKVISTGFITIITITLATSIVIIILHNYFGQTILKSEKYDSLFLILGINLMLFSINSFIISVLNGFKEFKRIIIINITTSFVGLLIAISLVIIFGTYGALLINILSNSVICVITYIIVKRSDILVFKGILSNYDYNVLKKLSRFTIMSASSLISGIFIQLLLRTYIIGNISLEAAGYWQGVVKISDIYLSIFSSTLILYYLPRYSEIKNGSELKSEVVRGFKFLIPLVTISSAIIYFFKDYVVTILFADNFYPMKELFFYQLLGNIFKAAGWLLSYLVIAKSMIKVYIISDIVYGAFIYYLTIILIHNMGVKGVVIAYAIASLLYFSFMIIIVKRYLRLNVS
ncbi:MAG TPA: O-antigen translocase [Ignavibacteriaceae bacterium]|nr:O-antigen translocase [Ignavibacteriaceae bacterium]